jgi:hypothetical protein
VMIIQLSLVQMLITEYKMAGSFEDAIVTEKTKVLRGDVLYLASKTQSQL